MLRPRRVKGGPLMVAKPLLTRVLRIRCPERRDFQPPRHPGSLAHSLWGLAIEQSLHASSNFCQRSGAECNSL